MPLQLRNLNRSSRNSILHRESVKPTLYELVFDHGPDIEYFGAVKGQAYRQFSDTRLSMDTYFDTCILSVLPT